MGLGAYEVSLAVVRSVGWNQILPPQGPETPGVWNGAAMACVPGDAIRSQQEDACQHGTVPGVQPVLMVMATGVRLCEGDQRGLRNS